MMTRHTPQQLPDLRLRMARFWDTPRNHAWVHILSENKSAEDEHAEAMDVRASITDAELFHVDATISEISAQGRLSVPDYGFMPWDLPSPAGLIYIEQGLHRDDREDRVIPVVLTWITHQPDEEAPHGSADISLHLPKDEARELLFNYEEVGENSPFEREQPDFVYYDTINHVFTEAGEEGWYRSPEPDGSGIQSFSSRLLTLCHLMRQRVASPAIETPNRAVQRRHRRAGYEPPAVRTIQLRHSDRPETTGESDKEWRHRWIVRGHWRRQWYASIEAHRPVWIAPHVKGPTEAPLLGGEKVNTID